MTWLLAVTVLVPLACAPVAAARPQLGARLAPLVALPALACAILAPGDRLDAPWLLLGTTLELDPTGRALLGAFAVVWILAAVAAADVAGDHPRVWWAAWLTAAAGSLGLPLAADAVTFYLCFGLLTFAAYPLVVHRRDAAAMRAGRVYVAYAVVGEAALLGGLVLAASAAGTSDAAAMAAALAVGPGHEAVVALLIVGLGVKAGLLGLHPWLPVAHPVAPAPASAVLSAALVKAGLLGLLRFLPIGDAALRDAGAVLVVLGLTGALVGVGFGLARRDVKTALAYSTVSQMGVMLSVVGVGLAEPAIAAAAVAAVTAYAVAHALAKATLFLGAGLEGGSPRLAVAGMVVAALALAGAPLTAGYAAKGGVQTVFADGPAGWASGLDAALQLSAAATAALATHIVLALRAAERSGPPRTAGWAAWAAAVAVVATAPWVAFPAFGLPVPSVPSAASALASAWPLLAGAAAGAALHAARRPRREVPAGDVLVGVEAVAHRAAPALRGGVGHVTATATAARATAANLELTARRAAGRVDASLSTPAATVAAAVAVAVAVLLGAMLR